MICELLPASALSNSRASSPRWSPGRRRLLAAARHYFPDQGLHKEHFRACDLSTWALDSEWRARSSGRRRDADDAGDLCLCPRIILKADEKPRRRCWPGPFPSLVRGERAEKAFTAPSCRDWKAGKVRYAAAPRLSPDLVATQFCNRAP
jgi:hypothetical protein